MRGGVDRHRMRAERHDEAMQALVQQSLGVRQRRQVPDGALEQVGARVLDAGRLGAGDRVPADEARVVHGRQQLLLGGAHVADQAARSGGVQRLAHQPLERAHRRAGEAELGALDRRGDRVRGAVDGAQLDGAAQPVRVAPEADDLGVRDVLMGGEPDRPADQANAEDGDSHPRRRACTAVASCSSTSEVVSQSMQASVIDWP